MSEVVVAHPAATVILLRDVRDGCEVLLVRRNAQLAFHGGAWVFPGGRIDAEDYAAGATTDPAIAAAYAAVREAREEAAVNVRAEELVLFSRWLTPENVPRRFDTWFFAARAGEEQVQVDGGEIHAHCWLAPDRALAQQQAGEIELPPPTYVTLTQIAPYRTVSDALSGLRERFEYFLPRLRVGAQGACTVYHGDVAYEDDDADRPGPRHRLWLTDSGWRYERSGAGS